MLGGLCELCGWDNRLPKGEIIGCRSKLILITCLLLTLSRTCSVLFFLFSSLFFCLSFYLFASFADDS